MRLLLLLILLLPIQVCAAELDIQNKSVQTPGGMLTVRAIDDYQEALFIGNTPVGLEDHKIWLSDVYKLPGTRDSVVVARAWSGGNGCGGYFKILRVSPTKLTASPEFGTCSDLIRDFRLSFGRVELELGTLKAGLEYETFAYSGGQLVHTETPLKTASQAAGTGADVRRWVGEHPENALRDPAERARFLKIMSLDELNDLALHVRVASAVWEENGVVIGQGCFPHQCNTSNGMWAIDVATGRATALINDGGRIRTFGAPYAALHWRFHEAYNQ